MYLRELFTHCLNQQLFSCAMSSHKNICNFVSSIENPAGTIWHKKHLVMIFISFRIYVLQHYRLGLLKQNLYRLSTAVCRRPIFLRPKIKARKLIVLSWHFLKLASVCRNWHRMFRLSNVHLPKVKDFFSKLSDVFPTNPFQPAVDGKDCSAATPLLARVSL